MKKHQYHNRNHQESYHWIFTQIFLVCKFVNAVLMFKIGWIGASLGKSDNFYVENTESEVIMDVWLAHVCIFLFLFPPLCSWLIMRKNPIRQMRIYGVLSIVLEAIVVLCTILGWFTGSFACICLLLAYNCCARCLLKLNAAKDDDEDSKPKAHEVSAAFGGFG